MSLFNYCGSGRCLDIDSDQESDGDNKTMNAPILRRSQAMDFRPLKPGEKSPTASIHDSELKGEHVCDTCLLEIPCPPSAHRSEILCLNHISAQLPDAPLPGSLLFPEDTRKFFCTYRCMYIALDAFREAAQLIEKDYE